MAELKSGQNWRAQKTALRVFLKQISLYDLDSELWVSAMPTKAFGKTPGLPSGIAIVAAELAQRKSWRWIPCLLQKKAEHKQSQLGAHARLSSALFLELNPIYAKRLAQSAPTILLLDDVYTTGASIFQASVVLRQSGARRVIPLVLSQNPLMSVRMNREEQDTRQEGQKV